MNMTERPEIKEKIGQILDSIDFDGDESLSDISRMVYKRLKSTPNIEVSLDEVKRTVSRLISL